MPGGVKLSSVSVAVSTPADDGKADVKVKIAGDDDAKAVSKDGALDIITHGEDIDGSADRALSGKKERSMKQDFYRILDESKGETGRLAIGAWFLLLTAICNMLVPYFAGRMTDAISLTLQDREADARREANEALYGLLTVGVVGGIFQTARSYLFNTASYKVVARLRPALHQHLGAGGCVFRLGHVRESHLAAHRGHGAFKERRDAEPVDGPARPRDGGDRSGVHVLHLVQADAGRDGGVPALIIVAMALGRRLRVLSKETQTALAEAAAVAEDSLGAIRTVRAFAREQDESTHFSRAVDKALGVEMRYGWSARCSTARSWRRPPSCSA